MAVAREILCVPAHALPDGDTLRQALARDGVVVVRQMFTAAEISSLRLLIGSHLGATGRHFGLGRVQPHAARHVPGLESVFAHPAVITVFQAILGEVVFTGHCDVHRNMLSNWHKDSGRNGSYFKHDCFKAQDCRVFKIGIYLQDHETDGLTVRLGSQHSPSLEEGPVRCIPSRAGDAIIFDVRLTHRGRRADVMESVLLRANRLTKQLRGTKEDFPLLSTLKDWYWYLTGKPERLSVFFTFGAVNRHTEDFAAANMDRQLSQTTGTARDLPERVCEPLRALGVKIAGTPP